MLALGVLNVEHGMNFVYVGLHSLVVVERMEVEVEFVVFDQGGGTDEFRIQELVESFAGSDDMGVFDFRVKNNLMEKVINFALKIFLRVFLNFL